LYRLHTLRLRRAAEEAGYEGVCVAPGGRLAVRYLIEHQPAGVVAIACDKELEEGLDAIHELEWSSGRPEVVVVPLLKDGCVDTQVDVELARETILCCNGCEQVAPGIEPGPEEEIG